MSNVCAGGWGGGGYQQEEFLRPQPDTLSDLTAMPRANQQVHINMNTHQKYHHNSLKTLQKTKINHTNKQPQHF